MFRSETVSKEPIAVIGLGCVLPDAPDVATFWENLLTGKSNIREVPHTRWDPSLFWSPDHSAPDKTYAKIGAFVADDNFNGLDYRMPPNVVAHIDPSQKWALSATRQAFKDAGYKSGIKGDEGKEFDRARCAVILGNAMGGEMMKLTAQRLYWPQVERSLRGDPSFQKLTAADQEAMLKRTETSYKADTPIVTEDSMAGSLSNVAAGRIANLFDLAGKNFTTDAACASSLAAIDAAIDTLRRRESDLVVWGGTDRSMDVTPYVEFSKIGALSADGSRPFDADANGFVMGEGCAIFLLKRVSDAERDGDKIYAVVRGVGSSSDGKGKGITAPNPAGQFKAVVRAYEDAEVDPFTLGYMEAHGTSTPVGDPIELTSADEAFRALSKTSAGPGTIAVGSVKSNMGHLKSAAGAVGLLKTALALKNGVIPPSINFRTPNPRIDWANSPFKVQTTKTDWPRPAEHPRRAAVSSFGFGGTNFHVVLEEHIPGQLKVKPAAPAATATELAARAGAASAFDLAGFHARAAEIVPLEAEVLALDGATAATIAPQLIATKVSFAADGNGPRVRDVIHPHTAKGIAAPTRVAFSIADSSEITKKLETAAKAATNPAQARLAFNQGIFLGRGKPQGKVAFLFPGQGTQYVNMLRDLAHKYEVVKKTFEEADQILLSELDGVKLTDILWPTPNTTETQAASEKKLQLTEFTQPAVLAADVALLRLLRQWGIKPDVVAGHSLGEYGALVAAGVLSFGDALHAVAARGREMAHVEVPDLGKMASVSADWPVVQEALRGIPDYVIPANKNCPSQTVIAGSSRGVDQAVTLLQQKGLQVQYLPVSAAFHSAIVAPASKPLRKVLARLDVKSPKVRVLSNVGAQPYQDDPEWIRDNLSTQVASPVEWVEIVERMYAEGVRTFIEVGPKRALTGFVQDILKERTDVVAINSNHPKKGGVTHANELFAFLAAWGFAPRLPPLDDGTVYTATFRDPTAPFRTPAAQGAAAMPSAASASEIDDAVRTRLAAFGFSIDDIGISGISVGLPGAHKELFADDNWDRILRGENLIDAVSTAEREKLADKNIVRLVKGEGGAAQFQVVSDIAQVIQLAGMRGGFDIQDYGVDKELAHSLDRTFQYAIAAGIEALRDAGIPLQRTYLETSQGGWLPKQWKLPEPLRDETGIIFASAFPGFDNLVRDVSRYLADKYTGRSRAELSNLYNDLIGVVADPGARARLQDAFDAEFARRSQDLPSSTPARYEFNRKFLFEVLSMGHSQLAQFIGARGPNTQVNAACASTTQAVAIAEDWIRTGRARRVLVVGADDVTSDALFEWLGAGFLASGAATTKADVREAALPFDKRRHGMIVGMGAVGLVVEAVPETEKRGMRPIARLLATRVSNSAFHGSRLDVDHISAEMKAMMATAEARYGVRPEAIARETVFMSHETYTPARGGSASAEIHALRKTFGAAANQVVVANTKGFTGHPQGASIEDAIVLKCLQRGQLPPIANFRDPDPELGDLNLSKGGRYDVRYALRLSAGFGSQVAMSLCQLVARENERFADPHVHDAWLQQVSGIAGARLEVKNRTLRIVDQGPPARRPRPVVIESRMEPPAVASPPTVQPSTPASPSPGPATAAATVAASATDVLERLIVLVAEKTGYPRDLLDPDLDMEADLGIDTVKQAELFGTLRDFYKLPVEDGLQIKDYPTLRKVAGYMHSCMGGTPSPPAATPALSPPSFAPAPVAATSMPVPVALPTSPTTPAATLNATPASGDVLARLVALVAAKTGYPTELLDPNLGMEADLGIDTVKQAELFGAIREAYNLPLEEGIQIKDYPTLAKVAGYVESRLGAAPPSTSAVPASPITIRSDADRPAPPPLPAQSWSKPTEPTMVSPSMPASLAPAAVLAQVTQLVAAKTGYPVDMLEPDLDMEADLGIDTVKQAELFGEVRGAFGIAPVDGIQLKDYPTLRRVSEFVLEQRGAASPAAPSATVAPPLAAATMPPPAPIPAPVATAPIAATLTKVAPAPTSNIVRRVPTLRPQRLPGTPNKLRRGPVLFLGDSDARLESAMQAAGFQPTTTANGQPAVGIVAVASRLGGADVGGLFDAAKAQRGHLANGFVLVVTRQDGAHGLRHPRDAGMAALAGLGKALKKEFPNTLTKVVDIHPETARAAEHAVEELLAGGPRTEVCYGPDATRFVIDVAPQALPEGVPNVAGAGLVVSGGAQGITVELLAALAPQKPKLLLLGRTTVPAEAAEWAQLDAAGWKAKEADAMAALKAKGERVTPVALQKAMSPMQKAAEVHRNLHRLQNLGATVLYAAIDVTDATLVSEAVAWARGHWGTIDGVLHAAGIEVSKDIASKERAQFDQVYGIKTRGWEALMDATRSDNLRFLVAFGSVAGRFGNLGQTDYSAANEYLCKAVKIEAARRKTPTAFTVAWGPWGETGMATKGSILQIMQSSGVTPIQTAEGLRHFMAELANPGVRESVVAGELGAIDADGQVVAHVSDLAVAIANELLARSPERFRLIDSVQACLPDHRVEATVVVDQARDPGLADHRVDGVPYLPGVFGIEAFAQAASLLVAQDLVFQGAENVRFASPLKQLKSEPVKAKLTAEVASREGGVVKIACRLTTQFVAPDGRVLGEPRLHFDGIVRFGPPPRVPVEPTPPACDGLLTRERIYPPFFHGPSFQVLAAAGPLGDPAVAEFRAPTEPHFGAGAATFHSQPMLIEALFQACGLRTLVADAAMSLPAALGSLEVHGHVLGGIRLVIRATGRNADGLRTFDGDAVTTDGRMAARIRGFAMIETGPAPQAAPAPLVVPTAVKVSAPPLVKVEPQPTPPPAPVVVPQVAPPVPPAPVARALRQPAPPIPPAKVTLPRLQGIHFAAVAVIEAPAQESWFTPDERSRHAAFHVAKRAAEWRAGRLAAKQAAAVVDSALDPRDVEVQANGMGPPRLFVGGELRDWHLSITHRDGIAIAAVAQEPVGVDVETIEERSQSFLEESFSVPELRALLAAADPRVDAACMWAAKEAALKRAGVGLKADLRAHQVTADGVGGAIVAGPAGRFGVRFYDLDGKILAVSHPSLDPDLTVPAR